MLVFLPDMQAHVITPTWYALCCCLYTPDALIEPCCACHKACVRTGMNECLSDLVKEEAFAHLPEFNELSYSLDVAKAKRLLNDAVYMVLHAVPLGMHECTHACDTA